MRESVSERLPRWSRNPFLLMGVLVAIQAGFIKPAEAQTQADRYAILYGTGTTITETAPQEQTIFTERNPQDLMAGIIRNTPPQNSTNETTATAPDAPKNTDEEIIVTAPRIEHFETTVDSRFEPQTFMERTGITLTGDPRLEGFDPRTLTLEERRQGPSGAIVPMFGSRAGDTGLYMSTQIKGGDSGIVLGLRF